MSKKPISFGKISFNISKAPEFESENVQNESTSGFGTFGRTPIQEQREIEEIADDLENQHVQQVMGIKNFGKKAKNFDIEEMMEQAKKKAQEANKKKAEEEKLKLEEKADEDVIGPMPPEDDELIGPPIPPQLPGM